MQNKYIKLIILFIIIAFVVPQIALAVWWNPFSWGIWNRIFHFQRNQNQNVACAMDAKQCPDGSFVGRVPPKCEFKPCPETGKECKVDSDCPTIYCIKAPCPQNKCVNGKCKPLEPDPTAGWKTFSDDYGFKLNYSADTNVMEAPTSRIVNCNPADYQNSCPKGISPGYPDKNEKQNINGIDYCFYLGDDCGMGSCVMYYSYLTVKNNTCYVLDFSTGRIVNDCNVYGSPADAQKCQSKKNANQALINQAISTIKFIK